MFWMQHSPEVGSSRKIIEGLEASSTAMDNLNEGKRIEAPVREPLLFKQCISLSNIIVITFSFSQR